MTRNVFDKNGDPPISQEEAVKYGGKLHSLLPPAPPGCHYEIKKLDSGREVVIVEQG